MMTVIELPPKNAGTGEVKGEVRGQGPYCILVGIDMDIVLPPVKQPREISGAAATEM